MINSPLQALILGGCMGFSSNEAFDVTLKQYRDTNGNYEPWFAVTGNESGETIIVRVMTLEEHEREVKRRAKDIVKAFTRSINVPEGQE